MDCARVEDWAYAAGIIDGEGSVGVTQALNRSGKASYGVTVKVAMTDSDVPLWLLSTFGGSYSVDSRMLRLPIPTRKPRHIWRVSGPTAASFLRGVIPHLRLKRTRAEAAAQLATRIGSHSHRLSDEERTAREVLAMKVRAENCRTNPGAKVTSKWGVN